MSSVIIIFSILCSNFQVQIYYDITFTDITVKNLLQLIKEQPDSEIFKLYHEIISKYEYFKEQEVIQWILYGDHDLRGDANKPDFVETSES